jgi:hypothetical protein
MRAYSLYYLQMILSVSQASVSGSNNAAAIIAISVAAIALLGTIFTSFNSARSAKFISESGLQANRISELENRISDRKYEIYRPMIELLAKIVMQTANLTAEQAGDQMINFSTWLAIYGSDEAVIAFRNFRQASFHPPVPVHIYVRLYAQFVIAARRDIGRTDAQITPVDILGMVMTDLYTDQDAYEMMSLPFDEVCRKQNWSAPWAEEAIKTQIAKNNRSPTSSVVAILLKLRLRFRRQARPDN